MDTETSACVEPRTDRLVYSVGEAAALLGISRAFAYELVARGELPVICLGRRRLAPKIALLALVETGSSDGADSSTP
jgi:excisionase family DNA binding protein